MLIIENGSGVVGAESYNSVAEADAYHLKMGNEAWPQPPTPTPDDPAPEDPNLAKKEAMLRRGAVYLDAYALPRVNGTKKRQDQGLLFPLVNATDFYGNPIDPDSIPTVYKDAQAQVALYSYSGVDLAPNVPAGPLLKRKKTDVLEKEWFEGSYDQSPVFGWLDLMLTSLFGPPEEDDDMRIARIARA